MSEVAPTIRDNETILPVVPLALLESVRDHDRPGEFLEDENLTSSLPRRFGLTDVVFTQIRRYEDAVAGGRKVPLAEFTSLLRLVLRRPDAELILRETGHRVARTRHDELISPVAAVLPSTPRWLVFMAVRRAARRLLARISGESGVRIRGKPLVVTMERAPTAELDDTACVLYTAVLEELIRLYSGTAREVAHNRCVARGDERCEWTAAS